MDQALPVTPLELEVRIPGGADPTCRGGGRTAPRSDLEHGKHPLAIGDGLATITTADIAGYYHHCGFALPRQTGQQPS